MIDFPVGGPCDLGDGGGEHPSEDGGRPFDVEFVVGGYFGVVEIGVFV